MGDTNLSVVLHGPNDLRLEEWPIPEPEENEVQLAVGYVGICGTDIHLWRECHLGDLRPPLPFVMGHESSGTVTKVGTKVTNLKPGDRVAIEQWAHCNVCEWCKIGRRNICPMGLGNISLPSVRVTPLSGTLTRYCTNLATCCHKLPDNVSLEAGAVMEPLSVAIQACRRGGVKIGQRMLVHGAGSIGLLTMLVGKAAGVEHVCVTDISATRLKMATKLGADAVVQVKGSDPEAISQQIMAVIGQQPDVIIECSGADSAMQASVYVVKAGGVIVLVGLENENVSLPIVMTGHKDLDIRGSVAYSNCFPTAVSLVASGKVDVTQVITHRYPLPDALEAFNKLKAGAVDTVKVLIRCERF